MPIADLIYPSDIACRPKIFDQGSDNMAEQNTCGCNPSFTVENCECKPEWGYPWFPPVPPPMPIPPRPYPPYPVPWPPQPEPEPEPEKGSVSQQICKLSRKANVITKMLENLEAKKKDVIINVGGVSYNFGNIDLDLGEGWPDGSYAATVKTMLEYELGLIKAKIAELAEDLGDEVDTTALGIEGTVGGN